MKHQVIFIIHLLASSIWVGAHLFLALRILPMAIKQKNISLINDFRFKFGKIGMPSLIILLITGILLAYDYDVTFSKWFSFSTAIETIVSIKLLLVFATLAAVIYTQKFVFPKLTSQNMLPTIIGISIVTFFSIAMLILGSFVRIVIL